MTHFWIIFVRGNKKGGWRAFCPWSGANADDVIAYRTKKEAAHDLANAKKVYGEARLYKFRSEAFIFGASK